MKSQWCKIDKNEVRISSLYGKIYTGKTKIWTKEQGTLYNEIMVYSKFLTYKFYLHMDIFCFI